MNRFDVWLANVRGNKYCREHEVLDEKSNEFWKFNLDHLIQYDMPAFIDAILAEHQHGTKLSILGFSQGTTITLGFLSTFPEYHDKFDHLIMLAATGKPKTLNTLNFFSNMESATFRGLFGKHALLEEVVTTLHAIAPLSLYSQILKSFMSLLFQWKFQSLSKQNHIYSHLYCTTSVELILHWFHIIKSAAFVHHQNQVSYDLSRVPCKKIWMFFGQKDSLEDREYLLKEMGLADDEQHLTIADYEHLDFLWSPNNTKDLYPHVLRVLVGK